MIVLSHFQTLPLLKARQEGKSTCALSLDLGLTESQVHLSPEGVLFPDGQKLSWEAIAHIGNHQSPCFWIHENRARAIQLFSENMDRFYSLMPTRRAPTLLIAGFPMHRIKGIDPYEDALRKINAIAPVTGRVLDTATGLGYTAIEAAKSAREVITIEIDPGVLEVARLNPWSRELFENPRIRQIVGDAFDAIERFEAESFACILHDPPTFRLAGELYSEAFYRHLFRVLRRGGRLFHYLGDPDSPTGRMAARGVVRRLRAAGFPRIVRKPAAFGLAVSRE